MTVDLDNRDNCAEDNAERCETCTSTTDLRTCTLDTPVGVYCATVCGKCVDGGHLPRIPVAAAAHRVLDHCRHLGIDLDEMAAQRRQERGEDDEVASLQGGLW